MSTVWNYVFPKAMCLEENIRKQIDCKGPSNEQKWTDYKIFGLKYTNRNIAS